MKNSLIPPTPWKTEAKNIPFIKTASKRKLLKGLYDIQTTTTFNKRTKSESKYNLKKPNQFIWKEDVTEMIVFFFGDTSLLVYKF